MRKTLTIILLLASLGCGGSGGNVGSDEESLPQAVTPANLTCIHAGQYYSCDNENTCYRDQNIDEEVTEIYEMQDDDNGGTGGLDQLTRQYLIMMKAGNITIISECGSNVIFRLPEENL